MTEKKTSNLSTGILAIAVCMFLLLLNNGIRSNFGLIASALRARTSLPLETISFAQAVAQLLYGLTQPFWGILALRKNNSFVLGLGGALMAVGLIFTPFSHSGSMLVASLGILVGMASGALAFGIVMGAATPAIGEKYAAVAAGLLNGASGLGGAVFAPFLQVFVDAGQFTASMLVLSWVAICGAVMCVWLGKKEKESAPASEAAELAPSVRELLKAALTSSQFLHLALAFFTCGFFMATIETHLYPQLLTYGYSGGEVAFLFTVYGVMGMVGPLITGFLSGVVNPKWVLGTTYGLRPVFVLLFFLLPKNMATVYVFVIGLGLTGAATVAPTTLLISKFFGSRKMPTLSGIAMVFHQIGSFLSTWLGGMLVGSTGSYLPVWVCSGVLAAIASALCYSIRECKKIN